MHTTKQREDDDEGGPHLPRTQVTTTRIAAAAQKMKNIRTTPQPNHGDETYITDKYDESTGHISTTRAGDDEDEDSSKYETKKKQQQQKKNTEGAVTDAEVNFAVILRNVRSIHSSDLFEEVLKEIDGCRWDAMEASKIRLWESYCRHDYMDTGGRQQTRSRILAEQEKEIQGVSLVRTFGRKRR